MIDYRSMKKVDKYQYLSNVLEKVKTCSLYKLEEIEGNLELMKQRDNDIIELRKLINNELRNDNIKQIIVGSKKICYTEE